MMVIGINKLKYTHLLIAVLMMGSSTSVFANKLDDQSLSEQYDGLAKLTPIIISSVKQDVQQPLDEQNNVHNQIANKRANEAKKDEIYSTVLTDYEWKKKDRDSSKPGDRYVRPLTGFRFIDISENPNQRHDIRVTTKDTITLYSGHEIDAGGLINR